MSIGPIEIFQCPVRDCGWTHVEHQIDPRIDANTLASVFGPGVMAQVTLNQRANRLERVLREHFKKHSIADWLETVKFYRQRLDKLLQAYNELATVVNAKEYPVFKSAEEFFCHAERDDDD